MYLIIIYLVLLFIIMILLSFIHLIAIQIMIIEKIFVTSKTIFNLILVRFIDASTMSDMIKLVSFFVINLFYLESILIFIILISNSIASLIIIAASLSLYH
jgi:hypothetical protein